MHPSLAPAPASSAARSARSVAVLAALLVSALPAPAAHAQTRVDNPFAGATWYVNPEYAANVRSSAAQVADATLKAKVAKVADYPTAFWMDRIAAINGASGRMGLAAHLDAALTQQKAGKPVVVMVVIYNLPGRDCSALASNGELGPNDIGRYQSEYIDPIAAIEGSSKYAALRIVNIVEIDSLPNILTNVAGRPGQVAMCDTMKANGNYITGVRYALSKLHAAGSNIYNYIDAGHHGWLGWDSNFGPSAQLFYDTASGATGGVATVQGFITNTANYSALVEPFLTVTDQTRQSKWLDFNQFADEKSYATAFRNKLVSLGFPASIGMIIDTSRNGWGGAARPTRASTAGDVTTMVNESRVDRRIHAGNWCNQSGAGLGERPQAVGADGIHAYVWVKPPGESDGSSQEIPNDEGKRLDRMCDPTYTGNYRNGNNLTGALAGAPLSGQWFHAQLVELVQNAYPPVDVNDPGSSSGSSGSSSSGTSGSSSGTSSGGAVGDFQLAASPGSLTVNQGESASATIIIGKLNGFTGTVSLAASGLPGGVTASINPSATGDGATIAFTASPGAATGLRTITLTGTAGALTHSASVYLTVNAAGSPSFALSASPTTLTLAAGGSGAQATVSISPQNGFSTAVSLSADGLPSGVTASFSNQAPTSTTTVTFSAASWARSGPATVVVSGTGAGVTKSTTLSINVTGGTSSSSSSGGASSGGTTSSGGTSSSSGASGSSSGGGNHGVWDGGSSSGSSGSNRSSGGCSSGGAPDVAFALLSLGGLVAMKVRRRRG